MKRKTAPMVDVKNLSMIFGDFYAVRDVSFAVGAGEIFGFLGANGAGKTTTIRVLCGLLQPSRGTVIIDGIELRAGYENAIKQRVGYMSQRFTLYDELSVRENFDFAASLRQLGQSEYLAQRDRLLRFIGFDYDLNTLVRNLPAGIKQQVALGGALLHDPTVIFLDEPTAGVAPVARGRFWDLIKRLAAQRKTIFVTTHYMDEAENCNRIALMRSGELIAVDSPGALKKQVFGKSLYNFTPRGAHATLPPMEILDMCEPYGRHYHVRFKSDINAAAQIKKYSADFEIESISPSLEDVFIKLVEGGAA